MKPTLTKSQAKSRLVKLRHTIDQYRYEYHVLNRPSISDAALDSLKHELELLEQQYPDLITPDSPSQRVAGAPLPHFNKIKHTQRMFSLSDVFTFEELQAWDVRWRKLAPGASTDYLVDAKLDGLAITIVYQKGILVQAATRGDGFVGEDVTQNIRTIESVPLRLRTDGLPVAVRRQVETGRLEVRGEVVMSRKNFEDLNRRQTQAGLPTYANPRNVSAGSIRQLDPKITAARKLDFYAWELVDDLGQATLSQANELLQPMGLCINPHSRVCASLEEIGRYHEHINQRRDALPFWIDGVVVKINNRQLYQQLGFIGKTPRAATAWKFSAEQATTVVEDIMVQVGRTGALTPVAHLQPVVVAGTTVARATLHNADEIARLDVRIGDTVIIQKAGDIIPEVVEVLPKLRPSTAKPWRAPGKCPVCKTPVRRADGETIMYCPNPNCPARHREHLYHFASRPALDIPGLGPSTIDLLIEENLVQTAADFFRLEEDQLIGLPLFAAKKAENLIAGIAARRRVPLDRFIFALGIRHIGQETSRVLAQHFGSIEKLMTAAVEEFAKIPDVGPVVAKSLAGFFSDPEQRRRVKDLLQSIKLDPPPRPQSGTLAGKSIVVTGTLETMTREEAHQHIRQAGGKVVASVSSKTSLVVVGADPGSKAEKAAQLGVRRLHEDEFRKLLKLR